MAGYAKLHVDIVDSSIWDEDAETCKVWITLLALSDETGFVRGSIGWLSGKARVSQEKCAEALGKFQSPDARSRTETNDGRRIRTVDRGWEIINYPYFRNEHQQLSTDRRRSYQRDWMRKKRLSTRCQQESTSVNTASASVLVQGNGGVGEGEAVKRRRPSLEEVKLTCEKAGIPESDAIWFWNKCEGNGWMNGGKPIKSYSHTLAAWKAAGYLPSQKAVQNLTLFDSKAEASKQAQLSEIRKRYQSI